MDSTPEQGGESRQWVVGDDPNYKFLILRLVPTSSNRKREWLGLDWG